MNIERSGIEEHNQSLLKDHQRRFDFISSGLDDVGGILQQLASFQVAVPSWALGTGGTRFGRFSGGGEPRNLEEKIEDIGRKMLRISGRWQQNII
jgi:L-rhamnose isomerase/sugar isomerase